MATDTLLTWEDMRRFLPLELDEIAVDAGALERRRGVAGGEALTRLLLLMALPGATLEQAAHTAKEAGIANLGKTAMFKRVCASEEFLKRLFGHLLRFAAAGSEQVAGLNLVAVDATVLCGPGSKGTDQVLHVVYDLSARSPRSVELTGPEKGESLANHSSFGPKDLVLADRGHGHTRGLLAALGLGTNILVRVEPARTLRLFSLEDRRLKLHDFESALGKDVKAKATVGVRLEPGGQDLRLVGGRNPGGEAVWLLTNLSGRQLPESVARGVYSKRWQVELFFKRLKSLAGIDELPSRAGPTTRPWVWAKLILASLSVLASSEGFSPSEDPTERLEAVLGRALENAPGASVQIPLEEGEARTATRAKTSKRQDATSVHAMEA